MASSERKQSTAVQDGGAGNSGTTRTPDGSALPPSSSDSDADSEAGAAPSPSTGVLMGTSISDATRAELPALAAVSSSAANCA
eukprot:5189126-Prymnesium_polylepis.1